jgi:hypothetical protein
MQKLIRLAAIGFLLAGCSSPEQQAKRFIEHKFPLGSNAGELREALLERGYYAVKPPKPAEPPFEFSPPPTWSYSSNGNDLSIPMITECLFRERRYWLAAGDVICWMEDEAGKLSWVAGNWVMGDPLPKLN